MYTDAQKSPVVSQLHYIQTVHVYAQTVKLGSSLHNTKVPKNSQYVHR